MRISSETTDRPARARAGPVAPGPHLLHDPGHGGLPGEPAGVIPGRLRDRDRPGWPGPPGRPVPPLVVTDDFRRVRPFGRSPQTGQPQPAQPAQSAADLLRRHLRVFPPAGPRPDPPRTSASAGTTSGAATAPCRGAP